MASSGAALAASVINETGIAAAIGGPLTSTVEGFIRNGWGQLQLFLTVQTSFAYLLVTSKLDFMTK